MHAAEDIYGLWTTEKVAPVRTSFTPLPTHVIHMLKNRKNPRKKTLSVFSVAVSKEQKFQSQPEPRLS